VIEKIEVMNEQGYQSNNSSSESNVFKPYS